MFVSWSQIEFNFHRCKHFLSLTTICVSITIFHFILKVNMGVHKKNEQYNDQMTDILRIVQDCAISNELGAENLEQEDQQAKYPNPTFFIGDYLTFERAKEASRGVRNGPTRDKQLYGLVPGVAEFHNQCEILKVNKSSNLYV